MNFRWTLCGFPAALMLVPLLAGVDTCGVDELKDTPTTDSSGDDDDDTTPPGDDDDDTTPGDDDDDDTTPPGDDDDDDTTTPDEEGCGGLRDVADGQLDTDVIGCIEATFEVRGFDFDARACDDLEGVLALGFGPTSSLWLDCQSAEGFGDADCDAVLTECF